MRHPFKLKQIDFAQMLDSFISLFLYVLLVGGVFSLYLNTTWIAGVVIIFTIQVATIIWITYSFLVNKNTKQE